MKASSDFIVPLADLAIIQVVGADAAHFLHGQLTHDVTSLALHEARLAGYCTPKGRLLGTMVVWLHDPAEALDRDAATTTVYMMTKADVAASIVRRLSMFVLRAKAALTISTLPVYGVLLPGGDSGCATRQEEPAASLLRDGLALAAQGQPWSVARSGAGTWITAPSANQNENRGWYIPAHSDDIVNTDENHNSTQAISLWQAADIAAGLPWVVAATQDLFIPQTLNLDLINGVSFTKGCYPGQEVVARSHYRGTVKRRMAYGVIHGAAQESIDGLAAIDTFNAKQPNNPCGRVINAALVLAGNDQAGETNSTATQLYLLMEIQLADLKSADFRLGSANGPAIQILPLPYQIVANE